MVKTAGMSQLMNCLLDRPFKKELPIRPQSIELLMKSGKRNDHGTRAHVRFAKYKIQFRDIKVNFCYSKDQFAQTGLEGFKRSEYFGSAVLFSSGIISHFGQPDFSPFHYAPGEYFHQTRLDRFKDIRFCFSDRENINLDLK